jgi:hypothetical protein
MSSNFNNAKIINVYYNKGDRKPYDVNGKPIAYIGEEAIGATEATTIRFYLGEDLDSSTAVIVTKRPDGERRLDLCEKIGTGVNSYYQVTLNAWYGAVKGKATLAFKVYNGEVEFDDEETPTEIISVEGRIVVSDIFNLEIAYAPEADLIVPADDTPDYVEWFAALSTKLDKAQSITVTGALPTLTGDVYDDRYFYVENEGTGRLYYINGSTAIEVVWQVGTLKLTATGNGELTADTGKLSWNQPNGTAQLGLYNDVNIGLGEDVMYYGKASATITKGQVIQFGGYQGDHILIKPAVPSEINANPKLIIGIAKQAITSGDFGYVAHFGKIEGYDSGSFAVGSLLWFNSGSGSNGLLTATQPTAPNAKILIAALIKAETSGAANNGVLQVRITIEPKLEELQNVLITSVANGNVLSYDGTKWVNSTRLTTAETDIANIEDGTTIVGKANADKDGNEFDATYLKKTTASSTYVPLSSKGQPNGVAPLGADNKILSIHLPGGVDDIKEFANFASLPLVGEASIIYVTLDTNIIYRWSGSAYVEISSSLALGETSSTAYRGDRGKTAYDHSQIVTGNPHGTTIGDIGAEPANANIQSHISSTTNPHSVTATQVGLGNVTNESKATMFSSPTFTGTVSGINASMVGAEPANANIQAHISSTTNPHSVTATQVGLGNVTNESKATMFATPTFTGIVTVADSIRGSATLTIDPATHGDATGKVIILGDLQVDGTTTTINSTTLEVDDKNIELSKGATNKGASNEAGITIDLGSDGVAEMKYFSTPDAFTFNKSVGIGTTSPSTPLHITTASVGDQRVLFNGTQTTTNPTFTARNSSSQDVSIGVFGSATTNYGVLLQNQGFLYTNSGGLNLSADNASGVIRFGTGINGGTERMRIASDGNIGIGTTSPLSKLTTNGDIAIPYGSSIKAYNNSNDTFYTNSEVLKTFYDGGTDNDVTSISSPGGINSHIRFLTGIAGARTEQVRINSSGNVGIGTTSPQTKLDVSDAGTLTISNYTASPTNSQSIPGKLEFVGRGWNSNVGSSPFFGRIELGGTYQGSPFGSVEPFFAFSLAGTGGIPGGSAGPSTITERMRITNGGNVGIGTNDPTSGQLVVKSTNVSRVPLTIDTLANHGERLQLWKKNNTTLASVAESGLISSENGFFVNTKPGNYPFLAGDDNGDQIFIEDSGDVYNANGTYGTISDLRLKENIVQARDYTEDLMKLRVVKYSFKQDQETKPSHLGFIAQEVEKIFPLMVATHKSKQLNDMKTIKLSVLIPMLVKTIQELNKRIEELEKK